MSVKKKHTIREFIDTIKTHKALVKAKINVPYHIYYINMDKDTTRRAWIEEQLSAFTTNFSRIKGVNGYAIKNLSKDDIDGVKFINTYKDMNKSEIGCTLSHLLAIKQAFLDDKEFAIIIEDDVVFDLLILSLPLDEIIQRAPEDWHIISLWSFIPYGKYQKGDPEFLPWGISKFYGAACYLINRKGMIKILNTVEYPFQIAPTNNETDTTYPPFGIADSFVYALVNSYALVPPIIFVNNIDEGMDSTIHTQDTPSHITYTLNVLGMYNESLQKQSTFALTLLDFNSIFKSSGLNIPYFLVYGTLLGVIREGKFIEHDEDMDVGIFSTDYKPEIEPLLLKVFDLHHKLGSIKDGYEISFTHRITKVRIDIFLFYKQDDFMWSPSFFGICDKAKNKMCRWKNSNFSLKPTQFIGETFLIPNDPEKWLEEAYGPDWMIPKIFNYFEGVDQGHYRNLILEDFKPKLQNQLRSIRG